MDDVRLAPLVGIAGCVCVVGVLLYPYFAADGAVGAYYGSGAVNPLVVGLFALVAIIVFAAGREGRTDPALAAGAALVFGLFMVVLSVAWGMTARVDAVILTEFHRWLLPAVSAVVPAAAFWYTRALGIL